MSELVCCIDLGTTRIKASLFGADGTMSAIAGAPAVGSDPPDSYELDAAAVAFTAHSMIAQALKSSGVRPSSVCAVAVASQRATIVPLGRDGQPSDLALSWQDARCAQAVTRFCSTFGQDRFQRVTGLPPSALWSLGKLLWYRDARAPRWNAAVRWALLHDYVLRALGSHSLVTEPSNASLTGLFDLERGVWSDDILRAAGLTASMLPDIVASGTVVGAVSESVAAATGLLQGTPLVAGGGDQQCAALGIGVTEPGQAGLCLGTAAVISCPRDRVPRDCSKAFFHTAHVWPGRFVCEGIFNSFGSSLEWGAALLGAGSPRGLEELAARGGPGPSEILFFPFLAGIGSPDFDATARGGFAGITPAASPERMARAVLEGLAFETRRILAAVEEGSEVREIVVSGGAVGGAIMQSILADVTGRELLVSRIEEATLAGAAELAWRAMGRRPGVARGAQAPARAPVRVAPSSNAARYDEVYGRYVRGVAALRELSVDEQARGEY